jgi:hypothetical protein
MLELSECTATKLMIGIAMVRSECTGQMAFEFMTIPFKLVLLASPLFFLSDLSAFLHRRPRLAIGLGLSLVVFL